MMSSCMMAVMSLSSLMEMVPSWFFRMVRIARVQ